MRYRIHRLAAILTAAYLALHLLNHLAALGGIGAHIAFMQHMRKVTRLPGVEALLLASVALQAGSGVLLVMKKRARQGIFERAQALSGLYLALFLTIHVGSVLVGRFGLGLDTNFYFAAAGLHIAPFPLFFVPYYGAAVMALVIHLVCAWHRRARSVAPALRDRIGHAGMAAGAVLAVLIVATFSGAFYPVEIPAAYRASFGAATE